MNNEENKQNGGLCILTKCIVYSVVGWMANQDMWAWLNVMCYCVRVKGAESVCCVRGTHRKRKVKCVCYLEELLRW